MFRRLVDFVGLTVCILLVSPVPLAAQEDTTPPVLTAFDFTPRAIDTRSAPETVTVTFSATDDLSGLDNIVYLQFRSPSGTHVVEVWAGCEKGSTACTASVAVPFPAYGEGGTWTVYMMYIRDVVGNTRTYSTADLTTGGFPTSLDVTSNADVTPPGLTAFDFTPRTIDTMSAPETVTVTFSATDDLSGLDNIVYLQFRSPSGAHIVEVWADCEKGSRTCTASVAVPFPAYGEGGTWTVYALNLKDLVGNTHAYSTADLNGEGFPTSLEVTSNADVTPPALTAFDFTPKTIDTTSTQETVTVTFSATDDLSGLDNIVYLQFRSRTGTHILEAWAGCEKGSRTCTASVDIPFPAYSEAGVWTLHMMYIRDVVGNTRTYSSADLAAMGWPTQLLNTDQAAPELLFINAGAASAGPKGRWTTVTLHALVQNIGNVQASRVQVNFACSVDGGATFSSIGTSKAVNLASGATTTAEYTWRTTPGDFIIQITLDPYNRNAEYDEANNRLTFPFTVR